MKELIAQLDKAFESRLRLGIMSVLIVSERVEFNMLKQKLDASDGNLASHLSALEKAGYISVTKQFLGKKPNTSYSATQSGRDAFAAHLNAMEQLIRNSR